MGATRLENSMMISFSSRALMASMKNLELKLFLPSSLTSVVMVDSFSPSSLAMALTEKVSGFLASQMMTPLTLRAKRAASLETRRSSSRFNSSLMSLSFGIRRW